MLLAAATTASAADEVKFEFHGFVGASLYSESTVLNSGGGQAAWFVTTPKLTTDAGAVGGDVRQTRLNFSLSGPQLFDGATARGFAEIDFFGGNTAGGFGDISIAPRLRIAFAELKLTKLGTAIRAGQDHDLVLGIMLPTTVGHVAFPLSYMNGTIGWRRPQIAAYQTVTVAPDYKLEIAAAVGRAGWNGAAATFNPDGTVKEPSTERLGVASGLPSFEGRVKLTSKIFEAFVAGHYNKVDGSGQGADATTLKDINTTVITAGGKVSYMGATVMGAVYTGKNLAPLAGNLNQWQNQASFALPGGNDVAEKGAWAQAGYNFTPELSAWALTGFANPDDEDLVKVGLTRARNSTSSLLVRYQNKGYTAGLEYTMFKTTYTNLPDPLKANQLMLSGMYFF